MNADVTVREVVDREYIGVSESDSLRDTVELLLDEGVECALVLRGTSPVGMLTDRDILRELVGETDAAEATAADAMRNSVPTIDADASLPMAIDRVSAESTRHLIVEEGPGEEPLGLLTEHDLLASTRMDVTGQGDGQPQQPNPNRGVSARADEAAETESFDEQSICESCGALARDLAVFNGQLLCTDCRSI